MLDSSVPTSYGECAGKLTLPSVVKVSKTSASVAALSVPVPSDTTFGYSAIRVLAPSSLAGTMRDVMSHASFKSTKGSANKLESMQQWVAPIFTTTKREMDIALQPRYGPAPIVYAVLFDMHYLVVYSSRLWVYLVSGRFWRLI